MVLRSGSRGSLVAMLQLGLKRAGYETGKLDGIFGIQTQNAVRAFQRDNSLAQDGIAGEKTFEALAPWLRGYLTHTITQGDTLYKLAKRYGTTVEAIDTANPGLDAMNLQIGAKIKVPFGFDAVPTDISWSFPLTSIVTEGITARYPFISRASLGSSVTGRPIYCLKIGKGAVKVFFNASIHANEWINTPVLLKFLEQYAKAYSSLGKIGAVPASLLFERTTLYVAPMLNPDGVDLVTGALNSGQYYSAARRIADNYPKVPFPSGWKANIRGTDLNLQFPAGWEKAKEIKYSNGFSSPAPRDFVGKTPLSEPESRAVYEFTQNISPALIMTYHSQGEIIYWKYLDFDPPRAKDIGERLSRESGYTLEITPTASGYAGYKDWFIQDFDRPGYTVETGKGASPLPLSQFDKIYSDNLGMLVTALTEASY